MNMHQFRETVEVGGIDTVLLPIGMLEAHGEHCALGTDTLIPREFVRRLDLLLGHRIIMAPEIPYGHSWALAAFPGTIDVSAQAFAGYVSAVCREFVRQGFRHIILLNGHGGNIPALSLVGEDIADLGAIVLTIHWWLDYRDEIVQFTPGVGHAGEDETSCALAIDAGLVDMSRARDHTDAMSRKLKFRGMGRRIFPDGNTGAATQATADKGRQIYDALVPLMAADIEQMWATEAH